MASVFFHNAVTELGDGISEGTSPPVLRAEGTERPFSLRAEMVA